MKFLDSLIYSISVLGMMLCVSCSSDGNISRSDNYDAEIYPDYKGVTIPCNVAPLNFSVVDSSATNYALLIESEGSRIWVNGSDKDFAIDKDDWQDMLGKASGKSMSISFTIAREMNGEWVGGKPFTMTVVPDSIDDFITYRLVPPGYEGWYRMGLYEHQLSTSTQNVIYDNYHNNGACVNCHTPYMQHSDRTLFHLRTFDGGTYIQHDGKIDRLEARTDSTIAGFVYPSWHPNGNLVAFSNNKTAQVFHSSKKDRIEVYDSKSDIVIYDVYKHEIFSSPLLKNDEAWATYPTFSPDGKWLYFCSANPVPNVGLNYDKVKYSLCRIAFDAEKLEFGNEVDTIISSSRDVNGRSVSFPRISPDGNFLVVSVHNYGNFSIWHKDSDLFMMDLRSLNAAKEPSISAAESSITASATSSALMEMKDVNSPETESYHSWSSNSRWLVFSSRRDNGLYTRPYFTYIDKDGKAHKPFMLPQDNPRKYYAELDFSYNIPEFMTSGMTISMREIFPATKQDSIQVKYRSYK